MYSQIDANKRKTYLLIIIFTAVVTGIGWFLNYYFGYGYQSVAIALVISAVMSLVGYYKGDAIALRTTGARPISKEDNAYVYRMVENLAITAGVPLPKVYIIDSPALNAFATGRDPEHASIAVTTGIVEALENEELEGVLGHELSHIKNYDIRVMTLVIVLVGAIALLSDWLFRFHFHGRGRRSDGKAGGVLMIAGLILIVLSPIIAELIKLAVSRRREYLADASGALLTRYPEGLARALEKISRSSAPLATASSATAHLFISNPFKRKSVTNLFSTHPPIEDRIRRLRELA
ncbi:MAG: Protease HtpX-like protein [Candidatus Magasanikbacteria bacterium GW2011_GWA2_56_11]|uniref:Protease HtpX homolog n=1 Tax=Candidatus Magasanikbacteria bacterium GW2011_GWA2_56_11 TaxID=1619044 RepID=A0A0G1YHT0_9BACT|nr:MAG: Protease HtpX-like protein [Candidatus Magasanikbacteria bacterium GW2011_GWA2_56_11]